MKGQIISIDAIIAITIFTVLVSLVLYFGTTIDYRASNIEDLRVARQKLIDVSDQLITTPGDPVFWHVNGTDIKSIGLAYDDHKISTNKVYALQRASNNDYNNFRNLLNVGKFDTYIELVTINETLNCTLVNDGVHFNLTSGRYPNGENAISLSRLVKTEDNRFCNLRLWVWK